MKNITKIIALSAAVATLLGGTVAGQAQEQQQQRGQGGQPGQRGRGPGGPGGGEFNREEFMKRMSDRMKEQFGITNDDEWAIIYERIQKVMEARRGTGGGGGSFFGGFSGRGPGGPGGGPGGGRGPGGGDGERSSGNPEVDALRKAIDAKASDGEITEKLAKLRESRKANNAKLATAQKELQEVLTPRQEAVAVMMGLLD